MISFYGVELFHQMVFNATVTHNNDYPRITAPTKGWRLSPAYDLVPAPVISIERRELAMTVGRYGRKALIYNLLSQSDRSTVEEYGVIHNIVSIIQQWKEFFFACGVSAKDIEHIAPAILPGCSHSHIAVLGVNNVVHPPDYGALDENCSVSRKTPNHH